MRYIENETPFIGVNGDPIIGPEEQELSLGEILELCVNQYVPEQGKVLMVEDWRALNKCFDVMEEEGATTYAFEDRDFEVLKKVVSWIAPTILRRSSPKVIDALDGAADKEAEATTKNGKVKGEKETVAQEA